MKHKIWECSEPNPDVELVPMSAAISGTLTNLPMAIADRQYTCRNSPNHYGWLLYVIAANALLPLWDEDVADKHL